MLMLSRLILMLIRMSSLSLRTRSTLIFHQWWWEETMNLSLTLQLPVLRHLRVNRPKVNLLRLIPQPSRCLLHQTKVQLLLCLKTLWIPHTSMNLRMKKLSILSPKLRSTFTQLKLKTWLKMTQSISSLLLSTSLSQWWSFSMRSKILLRIKSWVMCK